MALTIEEIKKRRRVVCICKGIPMLKIWKAMDAGCTTVEEVNKKVGSGSGDCGGRRCRPVIEEELELRKNS